MNSIRVKVSGKAIMMVGPEGTYSYYHPNHLFTGSGWDAETASLLLLKRQADSILILGLGGGTVARQCCALFPRAAIVGVEISARVLSIARQYFGLHSLNLTTVNQSGQAFMRSTRRRFDAIIDDMWPPGLESTKPFFADPNWIPLVRSRLKPGGLYAVNVYSRQESSYEAATTVSCLKSAFKCVREVHYGSGPTTVIVGGNQLQTPRKARTNLQDLAQPMARGLQHVHFRTLQNNS
jgi:spermidine synthase